MIQISVLCVEVYDGYLGRFVENVLDLYLWDETLFTSFIFNAIDFAIVTDILVPSIVVGSLVGVGLSVDFAGLLCENFVLCLEAVFKKKVKICINQETLTKWEKYEKNELLQIFNFLGFAIFSRKNISESSFSEKKFGRFDFSYKFGNFHSNLSKFIEKKYFDK